VSTICLLTFDALVLLTVNSLGYVLRNFSQKLAAVTQVQMAVELFPNFLHRVLLALAAGSIVFSSVVVAGSV